MAFLWLTMMTSGLLMVTLPFMTNFVLLVTARALQNVALGAFITADCSLIVYTMGPVRSRPFTMTVHSMISVGFLLGTVLVKPFLPEESGAEEDIDKICGSKENEATATKIPNNVDSISWPFVISGAWCVVFSIGYLATGL